MYSYNYFKKDYEFLLKKMNEYDPDGIYATVGILNEYEIETYHILNIICKSKILSHDENKLINNINEYLSSVFSKEISVTNEFKNHILDLKIYSQVKGFHIQTKINEIFLINTIKSEPLYSFYRAYKQNISQLKFEKTLNTNLIEAELFRYQLHDSVATIVSDNFLLDIVRIDNVQIPNNVKNIFNLLKKIDIADINKYTFSNNIYIEISKRILSKINSVTTFDKFIFFVIHETVSTYNIINRPELLLKNKYSVEIKNTLNQINYEWNFMNK